MKSDFNEAWELYPNRKGNKGSKPLCEKLYNRAIEKYSHEIVLSAINKYAEECLQSEIIDTEYVKQFNTWFLFGRAKGVSRNARKKDLIKNKGNSVLHGIEDYSTFT